MAIQVLQLGLDCHTCDDALKRERGCEKEGILPFELDGEMFFKCPVKLITPLSWEYIRAYHFYKKNMLPNGNGWANESDKYLSAMIVIDNEMIKIETEQIKRQRHG